MRQAATVWKWTAAILMAGSLTAWAQAPAAGVAAPEAAPVQPAAGGKLHGTVKSGNAPLPGVTVTAQNTLTGKRYSTATDIGGVWTLTIPQNGRYVIRTQFAAFAPGSQEAVLNPANRDQTVTFDLMLASRAAAQAREQEQQGTQIVQAIQQLARSGAQNLSLVNALAGGDTENQNAGSAASGAALPSAAGNSDFGSDSVAISGQSGQVSPLAGMDMDRIRDAMESMRAQGALPGGPGGGNFAGMGGGPGGGLFGGGGGFGGGRGGGFGGGGFGGGRGNFRGFNPGQPHGAIFWMGNNSAINAEPYSLRGQPQAQPASGSNRFGLTLMSAPYIPGWTKPSGKDTMFLTLSGTRSSSPLDEYATVPTSDERTGNFAGLATISDPANDTSCVKYGATPGQPFAGNIVPAGCISPQAKNLLFGTSTLPSFYPAPNLPGTQQNYHLLTTQQTNSTQAGVRYMRGIGANAASMLGGRGGGGRRSQSQGLRQSINLNYNWSHSAADNVNIFPELGGKNSSDANSVQAGYTIGYRKLTSIFNTSWNRSSAQTTNYFTNNIDVAGLTGIDGPNQSALNTSPLNYGLPNIVLSNFTGLNEQQPNFSISQTLSSSETLSWIHGKHNMRFGGDYRRVHRDFLGGGSNGSNPTGTFYFSGLYTGSSFGDFLLGNAQETTIDAAAGKSYLRDNVFDAYAQDDWRVLPQLTLLYGLRYEFFAPYTEKYGHLAFVDTDPQGGFTALPAEVAAGEPGPYSGPLPASLIFPFHLALAPRVGLALRLPKQTVLRAGFGMNYTVGQYATFATTMAHQPTFANEQTNEAATAGALTLASGFTAPAAVGNYAVDPHYHLPYVAVWNIDVQKTLPWQVVMNVGYNGSKGNHLDITSAPRPGNLATDPIFNYEQAVAFSKFNAGTLRLNKRLSNGIALGANYQYSHSIDDAGSLGGVSTVVAQNWQDLLAEEGNSSIDQRHKVSGTYLYEFPFGKDKRWLTAGIASHIFEGFSISGNFTFATGLPLTPSYQAATQDVARGTAGTERPNRVQGVSIAAGGGTQKQWFNTAAFAPLATGQLFGTASRNSIAGPGTVSNGMSLSKTMQLGDTRSMEFRASANNAFNTVQYSGVDTNYESPTFGQVTSAAAMRQFNFTARFRF